MELDTYLSDNKTNMVKLIIGDFNIDTLKSEKPEVREYPNTLAKYNFVGE